MHRTESPPPRIRSFDLLVVLIVTLASAFAVNPYTYGTGDNSITIPYLKSFVDPSLYPGDYLMAQRAYYYTYLWNGLGLLHAWLGIPLEALFFGGYLVTLYLTFLAVYRIALTLFDRREAAVLAMLLLMFTKETLASVRTIELAFITRGAATPFLLFAIDGFLRRDTWRPGLMLGIGYLIHPLTVHYAMAMIVVAALLDRSRWRQLLVSIPVFLLVASPILKWKHFHSPESFRMFLADPEWVQALRYRSAHHFLPFSWGWGALVHALVTLAVFAVAWRGRNREREDLNQVIAIMSVTIVAMCVIGVVGTEIVPIGAILVAQLPRSYQYMEFFAILYVAHDIVRRMAGAERPVAALVAALLAAAVAYHCSRHVIPYVTAVAMVVVMAVWRWGRHRDLAGMAFATVAIGLVCVTAVACYRADVRNYERTFAYTDDDASTWYDVQRWARANTDRRDGFIVPPYEDEEFRLHADRTIYGDMEDGGLMNANPAFGREWLRRMRMLGLSNPFPAWNTTRAKAEYCALPPAQTQAIAAEMTASPHVFLVWPCLDRTLALPERYRNEEYAVYQIR